MLGLQRLQLAHESVVLGVRDLGPGLRVVEAVVPPDLVAKLRRAGRGILHLRAGLRHGPILGCEAGAPPRENPPPLLASALVTTLRPRTLSPASALFAMVAAALVPARADAGPRVPPVASYTIEAQVNAEHGITGRETVRFTNRTRFSFEDLRLHLYLNAWKNDRSTWLTEQARGGGRGDRGVRAKEASRWGFSEIHRIALEDGTDLTPSLQYLSPDDGNPDDRTLVSVALPRPVAPGETLVFRVDWEGRFPRAVARTGWKDDYLLGAQWFPKLGVATDAGWNAHQFHAATEFFADFGDYDVTLTLPKAVKGRVGATGVLKEETEIPGDLVRVRFMAEDVHDFAFTACPRFEVVRDTFSAPGLPNVDIVLLLQPDHRRVRDRYLKAVKAALADYGTRYLPYPYPLITVVDPPWGSHTEGMEYPTLFVGGARWLAPAAAHSPEGVTIHEFGHQVFYGMLASNEFEEAHLDEGFNTYATLRAAEGRVRRPVARRAVLRASRRVSLRSHAARDTRALSPLGAVLAVGRDGRAVLPPARRQRRARERLQPHGPPPRLRRAHVRREDVGEGHEDVRDALGLQAPDVGGLRGGGPRGRGRGGGPRDRGGLERGGPRGLRRDVGVHAPRAAADRIHG